MSKYLSLSLRYEISGHLFDSLANLAWVLLDAVLHFHLQMKGADDDVVLGAVDGGSSLILFQVHVFDVFGIAGLVIKACHVVFLVVETDARDVAGDSPVREGVEEVGPLVHDVLVLLVGVHGVLDHDFVLGELLDGQVRSQEMPVF